MLGGFALGVLESLVNLWQAQWREIVVFLLVILVLAVRPHGLARAAYRGEGLMRFLHPVIVVAISIGAAALARSSETTTTCASSS